MTRDEIAQSVRAEGGMFAVIPAQVMQDTRLSMSARMLYGVLTWKCGSQSRCWATNKKLGEMIGLSAKRISALLSLLEERGHIEMELICDSQTGQVLRRYIYPLVQSGEPERAEKEDASLRFRGEGIPKTEREKEKEEKNKKSVSFSHVGKATPAGRSSSLWERATAGMRENNRPPGRVVERDGVPVW
jgi:hypothetical protein